MRLSRKNVVPILVITAGGAVSLLASAALLLLSPADDLAEVIAASDVSSFQVAQSAVHLPQRVSVVGGDAQVAAAGELLPIWGVGAWLVL